MSRSLQSQRRTADELQALAEDEADLKLANAAGEGRAERLENAYQECMQQLKTTEQQRQQAQQRYEQARQNLRDFGRTLRKFREVGTDPDVTVTRNYPGGFSFTVPPGERDECVNDLHDEVGTLRQRIIGTERTLQKLDRQLNVVQETLRELEARAQSPVAGNGDPEVRG